MVEINKDKVIILGKEEDVSVFTRCNWEQYNSYTLNQLPKTIIKFFPNEAKILADKTCHNYSHEALHNNTVHLSEPKIFNDPFDSTLNIKQEIFCHKIFDDFAKDNRITFSIGLSASEKQKYLVDLGFSEAEIMSEIQRLYESERYKLQNMLVCCFSDPTNVHSNLMWAHYANNHQGLCVEYELPEIIDGGTNLQEWEKSFFAQFFPVAYSYQRLDFSSKWSEMDKIIEHSNFYGDVFPYYQYGLILKGQEWSYEKEWRFIYPPVIEKTKNKYPLTSRLKPDNNFEFFTIKKVYLGCRMSEDAKKAVIKNVEDRDIHIYEACTLKDDYDFKFEEIKR